jgi:hypothetical protein
MIETDGAIRKSSTGNWENVKRKRENVVLKRTVG